MSTIATKNGARQPRTLFVARVCLTLPYWAGGLANLFA